MEKLLVNKHANVTLFDQDNNAIKQIPSDFCVENVYIADSDGQAINDSQVVDYKQGDLVMVLYSYTTQRSRIVTCDDPFTKADIAAWLKELKDNETV